MSKYISDKTKYGYFINVKGKVHIITVGYYYKHFTIFILAIHIRKYVIQLHLRW